MKQFHLRRTEDTSGVSGTGIVAEGIEFSDGQCVIRWLTQFHSMGVYPSMAELLNIHGHEGRTTVEWVTADGPNLFNTVRVNY